MSSPNASSRPLPAVADLSLSAVCLVTTDEDLHREITSELQPWFQVEVRDSYKDLARWARGMKAVAVLIDAEQFERIRRARDRFDELRGKIAEDFRDIPEEEGMAMIEAAVREVRGKK